MRNLVRVAGAYAVVGWPLIRLGIALETAITLPGWFCVSACKIDIPVLVNICAYCDEERTRVIDGTRVECPAMGVS